MTHTVKSLADTFSISHLIIRIRNSPNGYLTGVCYLALYYIRAKGSCITISLVFVACSIHSNWEVVVWDGALPGGGGMQDPPWQLRLDVLCWQQDQNHKGKITSLDHGKRDALAEESERNVQLCNTRCGINKTCIYWDTISLQIDLITTWSNLSIFFFPCQNTQPYTTSTY